MRENKSWRIRVSVYKKLWRIGKKTKTKYEFKEFKNLKQLDDCTCTFYEKGYTDSILCWRFEWWSDYHSHKWSTWNLTEVKCHLIQYAEDNWRYSCTEQYDATMSYLSPLWDSSFSEVQKVCIVLKTFKMQKIPARLSTISRDQRMKYYMMKLT